MPGVGALTKAGPAARNPRVARSAKAMTARTTPACQSNHGLQISRASDGAAAAGAVVRGDLRQGWAARGRAQAARSRRASRSGLLPKARVYSRLNCEALW